LDPISEHTTGPFVMNNVVGTFTLVRTAAVGVVEGPARNPESLVSLGPNPTRGASRFRFRVPRGHAGDLKVYGVQGQIVRSLFAGRTSSETSVVEWNGRDDRGARVRAGVYFVALRVDDQPQGTKRVVITH
jgi:hypothetical protein